MTESGTTHLIHSDVQMILRSGPKGEVSAWIPGTPHCIRFHVHKTAPSSQAVAVLALDENRRISCPHISTGHLQ